MKHTTERNTRKVYFDLAAGRKSEPLRPTRSRNRLLLSSGRGLIRTASWSSNYHWQAAALFSNQQWSETQSEHQKAYTNIIRTQRKNTHNVTVLLRFLKMMHLISQTICCEKGWTTPYFFLRKLRVSGSISMLRPCSSYPLKYDCDLDYQKPDLILLEDKQSLCTLQSSIFNIIRQISFEPNFPLISAICWDEQSLLSCCSHSAVQCLCDAHKGLFFSVLL